MDRLIRNGMGYDAIKFRHSFRLIDDVLSIDNLSFKRFASTNAPEDLTGRLIGGIYPSALTLNETAISNRKVHFIGMELTDTGRCLVLDLFDKRREFPFTVIRYPHMDSVIPTNIPYGVFTGLLYRGYRICSRLVAFISHACDVANTLVKQGSKKKRLIRMFGIFLGKQSPFRWKTPIWKISRRFAKRLGN